jgi:triosephosphate isomerase
MSTNVQVTFPLILVNLKSYLESFGRKAGELAKVAEAVTEDTGVCIGLAPQYVDISLISKFRIPVFSQHIDPILPGAFTGHVLPESVADAGAVGTIVNHSERRLELSDIEAVVERAKLVKLISVVCANSSKVGMAAALLAPEIIAIEPPELIGTGIAVSKAEPEIVSDSVESIRKVNQDVVVLCGAGISSGEDVSAAIRLGSRGVLVASGVVKAPNWKKVLLEFAEASVRV